MPSTPTPEALGEVPVVTLDPFGTDHHGEAARLRELGPIVRVVLPGGIQAWAVSHHAELAARGVEFSQPPAVRPYGIEAILRDDSGNWYSFTQRQVSDPQAAMES